MESNNAPLIQPIRLQPCNTWYQNLLTSQDAKMLNIAKENNLAETAFCVRRELTAAATDSDSADAFYDIRWFTCEIEMDLCGHATLAAAHVIFSYYEQVQKFVGFFRVHLLGGYQPSERKGHGPEIRIEWKPEDCERRRQPLFDETTKTDAQGTIKVPESKQMKLTYLRCSQLYYLRSYKMEWAGRNH